MVSKNKLLVFGFLFLLILFPVVNAQPFIEQPQFASGFFVEFTPVHVFKVNTSIQINAHNFNISNGVEIDNSTTICHLSLFNQSGFHLIDDVNMTFETEGNDWEFEVDGRNFTTVGEYAYLIDCQDSTNELGGFVAVEFQVTATGFNFDTPQSLAVLSLILILLFLSGSFLIFGFKVETTSVKIFLIALGVLFFLLTLGVSINLIQQLMLVAGIFSGMFVNLYRLFLILISGGMIAIVLYFITVAVTAFKKSRGILDDEDRS